jgi:murein endopeptidase
MLRPRISAVPPFLVDRVSAQGQSTGATAVYQSPDPVGVFAYGCLSGARCDPDQGVDLTGTIHPSALRAARFEDAAAGAGFH